jgi:hypothetical protein
VLAPLRAAAERTGWVPAQAAAALEDGRAAALLGDAQTARTALHRARDLAREHGMPHLAHAGEKALEETADAGKG